MIFDSKSEVRWF